jgi:hypothetical protein
MIRRGAIAAIVASEALAVYTVAELLVSGYAEGREQAPSAIAMVLVALAAFLVPQAVERRGFGVRVGAATTAACAYLAIATAIHLEFAGDIALWDFRWVADLATEPGDTLREHGELVAGAVALLLVWGRASYRGANDVEVEALTRAVALPFLIVTLTIVFSAWTESIGVVARAGAAYYVVTLICLALAQLSLSGTTFGELRAGGVATLLVAGTVALTLAAAAIFWIVFGLLAPIVGPPLGDAVVAALTLVLTPFAIFMEWFVKLLLPDELHLDVTTQLSELRDEDPDDSDPTSGAGRAAGYLFRGAALAFAIAAVVFVAFWFARLRKRARKPRSDGEATGIRGALSEDLGALRALFRRRPAGAPDLPDVAVRRLYLEVLGRAERAGQPRSPAETPEEFAPRLQQAFHTPLTDEITAAYEQARYAGRDPDPRLVADLERRWHSLGSEV